MDRHPELPFSRGLFWLLFAAAFCPVFLLADSPFLAQVHFPLEYPPGALRVDDFNVDGLLDVAVVHGEAGRLSVLLSLPATADLLGPPTTYEVGCR